MFTWRNQVFGNSPFMPLVKIVEAPSILIPGAIFGYDIGIFAVAFYFGGKFILKRMIKKTNETNLNPPRNLT